MPSQIELVLAKCAGNEKLVLARTGQEKVQRMAGAGWALFDARKLVESALMRGQGEEEEADGHIFVQLQKQGKNLSEAQLGRMVHLHRPFLVVYTDLGGEGQKPVPGGRAKREVRAKVTNYGNGQGEEELDRHLEEERRRAEYYAYGMARPSAEEGQGMALLEKTKGPAMLYRRKLGRKSSRGHPGFDPNDPMLGFGKPNSPWERNSQRQLLQSPNLGNSLNDIRALHENGYKMVGGRRRAKEREWEEEGEQGQTDLLLMAQGEKKPVCARHNLTVDFRELGWAGRIIAPKRFEAGFCAGTCQYPLDQDGHASNHAILQSLLVRQSAKNGHPSDVPPVCCAPEEFDSLTLLYFDERDNLVLKNYPGMAVLQCACR